MWDFMPALASSFAPDVDRIIAIITYTVGVWLIAVYGIFFAFLFLYRRRPGVRARYVPGTGRQLAWVLVPVALVTLCDLAIDVVNAPVWLHIKEQMPPTTQTVRVTGKQWHWEIVHAGQDGQLDSPDDVRTVNELHVMLGANTRFELTADDVLHSFSIPAFRLKQDAVPGRLIVGWFRATQTGTFDLQCSQLCGLGHTGMSARVIVHSPEKFNALMTAQAGSRAAAPQVAGAFNDEAWNASN